MGYIEDDDEAWERGRARRRAERRRKRRRQARIQRAVLLAAMGAVLILLVVLGVTIVKKVKGKPAKSAVQTAYQSVESQIRAIVPETTDNTDSTGEAASYVVKGDYTISGLDTAPYLGSDEVTSTRALLVDADNRTGGAEHDQAAGGPGRKV